MEWRPADFFWLITQDLQDSPTRLQYEKWHIKWSTKRLALATTDWQESIAFYIPRKPADPARNESIIPDTIIPDTAW